MDSKKDIQTDRKIKLKFSFSLLVVDRGILENH